MSRHRAHLPQLDGGLFLTDGGIETSLVFHEGVDLPEFAAFPLLHRPGGEDLLRRLYAPYFEIAGRLGAGLVVETPTWRASRDWGAKLGYGPVALARANRDGVAFIESLRRAFPAVPVVVSGNLGPRGDGYIVGATMTAAEAEAYHRPQIDVLAESAADMLAAFTLGYPDEAIGIVRAATKAGMPTVISFTVETDGHLPSGIALADAIARVDDATSGGPAYYMVNCAHPTHFAHLFDEPAPWHRRIRGVRANASSKSHAELNESTELDAGDPADLGRQVASLLRSAPSLTVVGGCCGTDPRHIAAIGEACRTIVGEG